MLPVYWSELIVEKNNADLTYCIGHIFRVQCSKTSQRFIEKMYGRNGNQIVVNNSQ